MGKQGVTVSDIAKAAGVSPSTVSLFLNGNFSRMREDTRIRIEKAVEQTHYTVNPIAKSLITGKMDTIGLLWSNENENIYFEDLYFMQFAKVVKQKLKELGYRVLLLDPDELFGNIKMVDGVIVKATAETESMISRLCKEKVPTVTLGRNNVNYGAHIVRVDDKQAGRCGIEYLISKGYESILILTHESGVIPGFDDRLNGASEELRKNGRMTTVLNGNMTEEFGYDVVKKLFATQQLPQALFCFNDVTAIGALKACRELNISIPGQLALLGTDDTPTVSELLDLSTIKHPIEELGNTASELVVQAINDPNMQKLEKVFPIQLVHRKSS